MLELRPAAMSHREEYWAWEIALREARPVFIDGKKEVTLRDPSIAQDFQRIVDDYVDSHCERRSKTCRLSGLESYAAGRPKARTCFSRHRPPRLSIREICGFGTAMGRRPSASARKSASARLNDSGDLTCATVKWGVTDWPYSPRYGG